MATAYPSQKKARVLFEASDGRLIDITGHVSEFSIDAQYDGVVRASLVILGDAVFTTSENFRDKISMGGRTDAEWKCQYCGSVNDSKDKYCGEGRANGCGASRSFLV